MSLRSILVHVDASPRCATRIALAAGLARTHGAHLLGLAAAALVEPQPRMAASLAATPDFLDQARTRVAGESALLLEAFERAAVAGGAASIERRWVGVAALEGLLAQGRHADLVVLGQCAPEAPLDAEERDLVQRLLLQVGRPVLVVPASGRFDAVGSTVMVAWKDTRESARAVHDALPILCRARHVHLVCLERPADNRHCRVRSSTSCTAGCCVTRSRPRCTRKRRTRASDSGCWRGRANSAPIWSSWAAMGIRACTSSSWAVSRGRCWPTCRSRCCCRIDGAVSALRQAADGDDLIAAPAGVTRR